MVQELGSGVYRLGDDIVNVYLVVEGTQITVVDAGVPGYWGAMWGALSDIGRKVEDVRAVILTHGHSDHLGFAEYARRRGIDIGIHELDLALAKGEVRNPARSAGPMRPLPMLQFLWWSARHGGLRPPRLLDAASFGDGAVLDVPGSPRVTLVPGHTPGSVAYHFADHGTLCVGDALATYAVTTGRRGPQLAPFGADDATALTSLDRIEHLPAPLVLPGHGPAWTEGIASAVARVRSAASGAGAGRAGSGRAGAVPSNERGGQGRP